MSSPEHTAIPLDAEMEKQRAELASIVHRHTWEDGSYGTAITTLFLNRHNTPRDFMPTKRFSTISTLPMPFFPASIFM